jgi:hypothetical protein
MFTVVCGARVRVYLLTRSSAAALSQYLALLQQYPSSVHAIIYAAITYIQVCLHCVRSLSNILPTGWYVEIGNGLFCKSEECECLRTCCACL